MKKSTKAALLSGLVFPGLGHLILRRYVVGLALICLAGWSVYELVTIAIDSALEIVREIESRGMVMDPGLIAQLLAERPQGREQASLSVWVLVACWIAGVFDSYRIGHVLERSETEA